MSKLKKGDHVVILEICNVFEESLRDSPVYGKYIGRTGVIVSILRNKKTNQRYKIQVDSDELSFYGAASYFIRVDEFNQLNVNQKEKVKDLISI